MNGYLIYVVGTICLVTITSVILMLYFRNRITNMAGMVLAMVTGMNVGLSAGVFFGQVFQGNLYLSTMVSILVGILAGAACGLVLGILSSLEGSMAGLMGGMMGAMLGEMISQIQAATIVNFFLTLSVSSLLLFQILPKPIEKETVMSNKKWFLKPFFTFIVLASYLFLGNQFETDLVFSKSAPMEKDKQKNNSTSEEDIMRELTINIHPSQYSYDPKEIILTKNQKASFILNNLDSIEHDIEIKQIPLTEETEENQHEHSEEKADFHLHASAKKQTEITFTPLQEGRYYFYCTIPGHKENGMTGVLIVQ